MKTQNQQRPIPLTPDALYQARRQLRLTQTAMGERLGVSLRTIQHWEKGSRAIPAIAAILLERIMNERVDEKSERKNVIET